MIFNFDKTYILNEGGNAIKSSEPIRGDLALPTANRVINLLKEKYPNLNYAVLGSTGKKSSSQTSGDIDLALQLNFSEAQNVLDFLKSKYPNIESSVMKGFKILSIGFPYADYDGKQKIVQTDLMFTNNLELAKFYYYSPDYTKGQSDFNGAILKPLMLAVLKNIDVQGTQNTTFENGHTKDLWKYTLKADKGLVIVHQSFEGKKGQENKSKKTIQEDTKVVAQKPQEIIRFMLGEKATFDTVSSFEKMVKWIINGGFPYKNKNEQIFTDFDEYLKNQFADMRDKAVNYILSIKKGQNESVGGFRSLGRLLESVGERIATQADSSEDAEKLTVLSPKEIISEIIEHACRLSSDNFDREYFDDTDITDNTCFVEFGVSGHPSDCNIIFDCTLNTLRNTVSSFGMNFPLWDKHGDNLNDVYIPFIDKDTKITPYISNRMLQIVDTVLKNIDKCEFDTEDRTCIARTIDNMSLYDFLTETGREMYSRYKSLDESIGERVNNNETNPLDADEIFLESCVKKLKKIVRAYGDDDGLYRIIYIDMPSMGLDDSLAVNLRDNIYAFGLLCDDKDELIVRFEEDDMEADVTADNDMAFKYLSNEDKLKLIKYVEQEYGTSLTEISERLIINESIGERVSDDSIGQSVEAADKSIADWSDPYFFVKMLKEQLLLPKGLTEAPNDDDFTDEDFDFVWVERPKYYEHNLFLKMRIKGDSDIEYPLELIFSCYDGKTPNVERKDWGVMLRFEMVNEYLDFVLDRESTPFRMMGGNYAYYYPLSLKTFGNVVKVLETFDLTHDWMGEVVGIDGEGYSPLYMLGNRDDDTAAKIINCDLFNLSKLRCFFDKKFEEYYSDCIAKLQVEEDDDYEEYNEEDEEY